MKGDRRAWLIVVGVALAMLAVTSLPYLFGHLSAPADKAFVGVVFNVADNGEYWAWMRELEDSFLIRDTMTPEPNDPLFFNLLWWVLARLRVATGLSYLGVYQVFRWTAGVAFALVVYWLCRLCFRERARRLLAFLVVMLASGFGWFLVVLKQFTGELSQPLAVYVAEANTFFSFMAYPHFVIAGALIVLVFGLFIVAERRRQWRWAILAGGVALVLGLQHAYDLVTVYGVLGVYVLVCMWRARAWLWFHVRALAAVGLISCGPPLYFFYLTRTDPLWRRILEQFSNTVTFTPDPVHLLVLLGPILPLGAAAIIADLVRPQQAETPETVFVKTWALVMTATIYLPLEFQIHLLNPWQVPLGILTAAFWLERVVPWARARWPRWSRRAVLSALLLLLLVPTNVYLWLWRFVDLGRHDYPYYIYRDDAAALQWIEQNAAGDEVVLSSQMIGQFVPGMGGSTAFVGHYATTLDYYDKLAIVERFFDAQVDDAWRERLIQDYDIRYVYYGENERVLGTYDPEAWSLLEPAFSWPRVTVYRVLSSQ
jgi:hypothetical protein